MKAVKLLIAFCATFAMIACAGAKQTTIVRAQDDELDLAIRQAASYFNGSIENGTKIAVLAIKSDYPPLSEYVIDVFTGYVVNDRKFKVVERSALDAIRNEMDFQMSGEVDDNTVQKIGRILGAHTIIIGAMSPYGDMWRMTMRALAVESAEVVGLYNKNISKSDAIAALTAGDKKAVGDLNYAGRGGKNSGATSGENSGASGNLGASSVENDESLRVAGSKSGEKQTANPTYKVGDTGPAGGLVFYDKGNSQGGWRYLEVAPVSTERELYIAGDSPYSHGNKNKVGDGLENTRNFMATINKDGGGINSAAWYVTNLTFGGFNDWYLPSFDEIVLMYNLFQNGVGDFRGKQYWHSSEHGVVYGAYDFSKGERSHGYGYENDKRLVRPVRRF